MRLVGGGEEEDQGGKTLNSRVRMAGIGAPRAG